MATNDPLDDALRDLRHHDEEPIDAEDIWRAAPARPRRGLAIAAALVALSTLAAGSLVWSSVRGQDEGPGWAGGPSIASPQPATTKAASLYDTRWYLAATRADGDTTALLDAGAWLQLSADDSGQVFVGDAPRQVTHKSHADSFEPVAWACSAIDIAAGAKSAAPAAAEALCRLGQGAKVTVAGPQLVMTRGDLSWWFTTDSTAFRLAGTKWTAVEVADGEGRFDVTSARAHVAFSGGSRTGEVVGSDGVNGFSAVLVPGGDRFTSLGGVTTQVGLSDDATAARRAAYRALPRIFLGAADRPSNQWRLEDDRLVIENGQTTVVFARA